jgi:hypothetical protein
MSERHGGVDLLVVLAHAILVRNFVADGCLEALAARGLRIAVVAPGDTLPMIRTLAPSLDSVHRLDSLRPTARRIRLLQRLRVGSFYARRDRDAYELKIGYARRVGWSSRLTVGFWSWLARSRDSEAVARGWVARLRPRPEACALLDRLDPAIVLWPTTISDPTDFELVQAAAQQRRRLVMCEGSWDNLVTKGAIWPRPDHVLVWGDFSRRLALSDHGFTPDQIDVTGPPHFGVYRDPAALTPRAEWCAQHQLDPGRRLIFVAGSTIGQKVEPLLLRLLSAAITAGRLPPAYVWYRPHPKVGARFDATPFASDPHVRIDPSIAGGATTGMARIIHASEARQRADALVASDVIVSMFSTVVLEGALLGKPVLLVDMKGEAGVSQRPTTSYERMAHLRHVLTCPLIRLVPNLDALPGMLAEVLALDPGRIAPTLRAFAQDVMSCPPEAPAARIARVVEPMLAAARPHRRDGASEVVAR